MENRKEKSYKEKNGTSKVGDGFRWLIKQGKEVAPELLQLAGSLTGVTALGTLANKISDSPDISQMDKDMLLAELELDIKEYEIQVADRNSARNRQVEIAKSGKKDLLYNVSGFIGLGVFAFVVYSIVFLDIPSSNKEIFIHLIGIVEGVALSIFGFFFGSSDVEKKR
jgi:hypothetical protein